MDSTIVYASVLFVVALLGLVLTLIGLPGNWLIVIGAAVYAWFGEATGRAEIAVWGVVALAVLAAIGEVLEFAAGAWGAKRAGGSRRAAVLALAGSVAGGIAGAIVGVPIPIVGPVIAAVLFAALGALGGALVGELWKGRPFEQGMVVGKAAFHGRLLGILAKFGVGLLMVLLLAGLLLI